MILVALGSNMSGDWGSPRETLERALAEMPKHRIDVLAVSPFIETAPFGLKDQPNFINAVARVDTKLGPDALMLVLHTIEKSSGRKRLKRWGSRTLDLDLLDYNGLVRAPDPGAIEQLALPHPGIELRTFVLEPLLAVAPDWVHPVSGKPAALTLRQLNRLNAN
jgi:2-amino-4-hydroxy-6-hydroxymethyldihydropteridine diphosphokinase